MTETSQLPTRPEIERAVGLGVRAPSIHNTQPWLWVYRPGVLELYADWSRQLPAVDPDGRSVLLSCGAALELTRLGFAAAGWQTTVERRPDPRRPSLLARIRPTTRIHVDPSTVERAAAAERRHTERRPFAPEAVPAATVQRLLGVATDAGTYAYAVERADERLDLAVVFSWADRVETADPAYRAELRRWTRSRDADAPDGVPSLAVPHVPEAAPRHTDVPLRDFEEGITGGQTLVSGIDERPTYIVVFSLSDGRDGRLGAGEAYARIAVEAERLGLASSAMTQAVDLPGIRERFRALMNWPDHPQMVLRLGNAVPGAPSPATGRRPLISVLTFED